MVLQRISYHFFDNENKYLKILITIGILFDIVYTNTYRKTIYTNS